jgi:ABC-type tungstate transport system permease subunit
LVHASGGTFEVFNDLSSSYGFGQNSDFILFSTAKRGFLNDVAERKGYTLYGTIPFLMKKQHNSDLIGFIFEDKKLQRPYLAAIGSEKRLGNDQYQNAQKLLAFLTSNGTQQRIKHFRIEGHENTPVFFPIKP